MRKRGRDRTEYVPPNGRSDVPDPDPPPTAADATGDVATPDVDVVGEAGAAATMQPEGRAPDAERDEQRDKYLRLAADFENYRRRMAKERAEAGARGQSELVRQMIEALDDLARFAHLDPAATDSATVVEGVEMVERKLQRTLADAGLQIINPVDEPFDPERHEAVGTEPAQSQKEDHTVARVYQPGYLFKGQMLRPAQVVVRQWSD